MTKNNKMTWEEWSKKLAKEAEGITEKEINETLEQLKYGDYSCIGPDVTQEEAKKLFEEIWQEVDKKLELAKKLQLKKKSDAPDKVA